MKNSCPRSGIFTRFLHREKSQPEIPYDPQTQYPIVKSSICTGEKVAGFRDKNGSHFTEVMVIRTPDDLNRFKAMYGLETVTTEY